MDQIHFMSWQIHANCLKIIPYVGVFKAINCFLIGWSYCFKTFWPLKASYDISVYIIQCFFSLYEDAAMSSFGMRKSIFLRAPFSCKKKTPYIFAELKILVSW